MLRLFARETAVDVSGRSLEELPDPVCGGTEPASVTALVASNNLLRSLNPAVCQLGALTRLELDDNRLRRLPAEVTQLGALHTLSLRRNDLTRLDAALAKMARLRTVALEGNPLAWPPRALAEAAKSWRALAEWMSAHPSHVVFRAYLDATTYVDLDLGTAHAQVKASKKVRNHVCVCVCSTEKGRKNEDRWDTVVVMAGTADDAVLAHVDLDDEARTVLRKQGAGRPNASGLNVHRARALFMGMYDGHGGKAAAAALQQNLYKEVRRLGLLEVDPADTTYDWRAALSQVFTDVDQRLLDALEGLESGAGSTCTVALLLVGNGVCKLVVAHVGDSRVVAAVRAHPAFVELTRDHHPGDPAEREAVEARGGTVTRKGERSCLRVNGDLNMTRSLGDKKWKRPQAIISCVPDVMVLSLDDHYEAITVASDGLWAYFNSEMSANYARKVRVCVYACCVVSHALPLQPGVTAEEAASAQVGKVKSWIEGTTHKGDNTSATVLKLAWGRCRPEAAVTESE